VWNTKLDSEFPTQKTPAFGLVGHSAPICSIQIIGTSQASHIISASNDGIVCSWQLNMLAHPVELLELSHPQDTKWDSITISSLRFPKQGTSTFWIGTLAGNIHQINRFDRAGW
jgi:dynein intermediate chain